MPNKIIIPSYAYLKRVKKEFRKKRMSRNPNHFSNFAHINHISDIIHNSPAKRSKSSLPTSRLRNALEHLGVFILDEEHVHEEYIKNELEANIYDNFVVSSVQPIAHPESESSDLPDFWHKDKLNVSSLGLTGKGIRVGVMDSGIYAKHQEFEGKDIHFAHFDKDGKYIDNNPKDYGTHGTHVCGLLAGKNAGIAPDVSLSVAAVLTEKGGTAGYLTQILAGLNWLLGEEKVHLINASIESSSGFNDYLYSSLQMGSETPGTLMVAAIGNNGSQGENSDTSPGNYDLTLGIGALSEEDTVASFSSWGQVSEMNNIHKPDLSAPGVYVYSSLPGPPGNRYFKQSGTSMASPIACGMGALLMEKDSNYIENPSELKNELINSVVPIQDTEKGGKGRVNIEV